jgi:hypothetical protein
MSMQGCQCGSLQSELKSHSSAIFCNAQNSTLTGMTGLRIHTQSLEHFLAKYQVGHGACRLMPLPIQPSTLLFSTVYLMSIHIAAELIPMAYKCARQSSRCPLPCSGVGGKARAWSIGSQEARGVPGSSERQASCRATCHPCQVAAAGSQHSHLPFVRSSTRNDCSPLSSGADLLCLETFNYDGEPLLLQSNFRAPYAKCDPELPTIFPHINAMFSLLS